MKSQLLILDFGSQYTQLIARAIRELGVYCEIAPGNCSYERILAADPKALILSGGPASVLTKDGPRVTEEIWNSNLPILGICYGMQLMAQSLGGKVEGWGASDSGSVREFGPAKVVVDQNVGIFSSFSQAEEMQVWMSHGDKVTTLPDGFSIYAESAGSPVAAFGNLEKQWYGVQFHPEVHHTPRGKSILESFIFEVSKIEKDWNMASFVEETVTRIASEVPDGNVICGLSGGVDSSVAAVLVNRALGERLHCIFVDNGLLRKGEAECVMDDMRSLGVNVTLVDAAEEFLSELSGITDPEQKRKIIGRVFIEVFEKEALRIKNAEYLVQGTLYPDVIESISVIGNSVTIKSHHNVGGLTDNMKLKLIEPLRELFKDEVRAIGREMEMPERIVARQPFPGPGLAVRCLGEITKERLLALRQADSIVQEEVTKAGFQDRLWQSFAVLLPIRSVGVMGDGRTFEECVALRVVTSRDGMTADWFLLPEDLLRRISSRIVNETAGVNRVVLDITTKPPSTIEWE